VGPDGHPVYVRRVTNVGLNLGFVLPVLGNTTIDEMIDESTEAIAELGSDHVRVIASSSENYWYGFPPLTWFLTPVITDVTVEYRPSLAEISKVAAADALMKKRAALMKKTAAKRREQGNTHIRRGRRR
jgi:hypothetical protein